MATALSPLAQAALHAWEPVSHRLATVRLKGAVVNITVISIYTPILNAAEKDKDIYHDLQAVVDSTPSTDLLVVAGDWNACTGPADENTRYVLGRFALSTWCDNGDRLANFAVANHLVVTNTRFQHPRCHLVTWYSNDGHTSNQNDYILVWARWASSVLDSRAYQGADMGSAHGSDHTLVRTSLPIWLQARRSTKIPKWINVTNLKLRTGEHIRLELHNRFSLLQPRSDPQPETEWQALKSATVKAIHTHLGVTRHQYRDWITGESLQLAERARVAQLTGASNFHGHLQRLTYESLKCSTMIAAESIVCLQLLYVITWTSVLFHPSCSSVVSDGSGMQLDTKRKSSSAIYISPFSS